jgi:hypothetical protein
MIKDNGTERPSQRMSIKPFANEFSIFSMPCYSPLIARHDGKRLSPHPRAEKFRQLPHPRD